MNDEPLRGVCFVQARMCSPNERDCLGDGHASVKAHRIGIGYDPSGATFGDPLIQAESKRFITRRCACSASVQLGARAPSVALSLI